jgi:BASS family bile acid:Na+ symporter
MKQWVGLGKFLAGHMQIIVPICVTLGVLFPQQIGVLKPIVPTLFAFMTFQGALSNTFHQVAEVFRRPLHLILALFVSAVIIPIAAYAMGSLFFGSNPNLVCGIVLEYSVPVAVTAFMWISMFGGNGPLALTIILTSSVISPVTIPLTLKLLLGATVSIDVPSMMQNMAFMIAIPAVLGIVINELTRGWGHEKLSPALSPACKFMMMGVIASNSTAMSEYVLHMNVERLEVAISGFIIGVLIARALHLPYSETTTMCFTCGMRNISSGAVIATQYFPGEVVFPVMCGTLFQQVLASIIGHLFERLTGEERAAQRKRVEAGRDAMAR